MDRGTDHDPVKPERDDPVEDQLVDLLAYAHREGMYKAWDFVFNALKERTR